MTRLVVGVDVGGTFTDLFFLDEAAGRAWVAKVPSVRGDQGRGIVDGVEAGGAGFAEIATIVHGTTVGTNALLERKGAPTGIIATRGFADVLEMRRRDRPTTWGLHGGFAPVVPRNLRLEVDERTLADGTVRTPVDLDQVREAARALVAAGCEAVAIAFINAYANPANERLARDAVRAIWPNPHVTASSDILPEIREFERTSTAALNASLQPVVGGYLERLEDRVRGRGFAGELLIVQSNGGVMSVETARARPVRTALSGPAAGVIAAGRIAAAAGYRDVITCDMGGTSFDVSLIAAGESALAAQTSIDFGLVVRTPMIEIVTIGAGGGSIAGVDRGGLLQIGPESAGADPGPACYGRGNDLPTVTDANVVLGRIDPARPIGGRASGLDVDAAARAIERHVGVPLGLGLADAAAAIVRVANSRMAGALRLVSIERGHDPKRFVAMPFGGGGALHAGALIAEVGLARALVPRFPGVTSALGCVLADMRHDFVQTLNRGLDEIDPAALAAGIAERAREGRALLDRAEVALVGSETVVELDMHYLGQTHTVAAVLPMPASGAVSREAIRAAFEARYRAAYGRLLEAIPIRILNLRVAVIGRRPQFDLALLAPPAGNEIADAERPGRRVWAAGEWRAARVLDRLALPAGAAIEGPAVLEQPDATTFVESGQRARVDRLGNLIVEPAG